MLRIIGWVGGTCFAALFLALETSTKLIGVAFGLLYWVGAAYAISAGWLRIQAWRAEQPSQGVRAFGREDIVAISRTTITWPFAFLGARAVDSFERLRLVTQQHAVRERRLGIAGFCFLALCLWILGAGVILQCESFGFLLGIMASPAMLATAWWLFRRLRRNYTRFFTARQFDQIGLHLTGSLVLAVSGMAILVAVF